MNVETLISDYFNLLIILISLQSEEIFSGKKFCGCQRWCECLIYRTRKELHVYTQVNSATQIQLEETNFAKTNTEQRFDDIISILEASITIPNAMEMQI